jgi:hypothetical protein
MCSFGFIFFPLNYCFSPIQGSLVLEVCRLWTPIFWQDNLKCIDEQDQCYKDCGGAQDASQM